MFRHGLGQLSTLFPRHCASYGQVRNGPFDGRTVLVEFLLME
jgi:hypothetical protein